MLVDTSICCMAKLSPCIVMLIHLLEPPSYFWAIPTYGLCYYEPIIVVKIDADFVYLSTFLSIFDWYMFWPNDQLSKLVSQMHTFKLVSQLESGLASFATELLLAASLQMGQNDL